MGVAPQSGGAGEGVFSVLVCPWGWGREAQRPAWDSMRCGSPPHTHTAGCPVGVSPKSSHLLLSLSSCPSWLKYKGGTAGSLLWLDGSVAGAGGPGTPCFLVDMKGSVGISYLGCTKVDVQQGRVGAFHEDFLGGAMESLIHEVDTVSDHGPDPLSKALGEGGTQLLGGPQAWPPPQLLPPPDNLTHQHIPFRQGTWSASTTASGACV